MKLPIASNSLNCFRGALVSALAGTVLAALGGFLSLPIASFGAEMAGFDDAVGSYFQTYCLRCHNEDKQKGEFRLDTLSHDFADAETAQRWDEVISRMNSGEMPPEDEKQPAPGELGKTVEWLQTRLNEGQAERMAGRGPMTHYRLSRTEYQNTIYDLLGVYYDVSRPGVFNPDPLWHGFDRIGSMLSLSPSHVEHYLKAAGEIIDSLDLKRPAKSKLVRKDIASLNRLEKEEVEEIRSRLKELGREEPMRHLIWPGGRMQGFNSTWLSREGSGLYRARIQVSGLAGLNGDVPHLTVRSGGKGTVRTVFDADVLSSENEPVILEFETHLQMPATLTIFNEGADEFDPQKSGKLFGNTAILGGYKEPSLLNPTAYKLFTEDGRAIYPLLLVDWVEWEGPLVPEDLRTRLAEISPQSQTDPNEVRNRLKSFAGRAWRRPVSDDEIEPYVALSDSELKAGEKFDSAYRAALVGILASSQFYYLQEGSPEESRDKINDWELASRLSYFLFNSMPDEPLFASARSGALHTPGELRLQLRRLFEDPKFERFLDSFPYRWLKLHQVGMFQPNEKLYPEYSPWLERSMIQETKLYFREMFRENLPLREMLQSDWSMLNSRLRAHYGLSPSKQTGFEKVPLVPGEHRGGLLTQGSILSLTSDGQRHRPVHRGVWLSEAIFNRTPPAPPANVEPLEPNPEEAPKATIRMQLQAHATQSTCASCHSKIDPLGFAFENYDAIGRWRTEEEGVGQGKNPPVNAAGKLPDGREFKGPEEFKALLVADQQRFAEAFTEQLATYALRRVTTIDDAGHIRAIIEASKKDEYRLRTLIENFVLSELFQKR